MSLKKDFAKVEYRIKLLSGNNVVLVEANGFESEIFVPEIQNGRINFQNIIPNRRCCLMYNPLAPKNISRRKRRPIQTTDQLMGVVEKQRDIISPCRTWRLQGGDEINRSRSPLAFSTPAPAPSPTPSYTIKQQMKYTSSSNKENYSQRPRSLAQAYQTIELLRAKGSTPIHFARRSIAQTPCTKTVHIQCEQSEIDRHLNANCGDSGTGFNIPDVPNISPRFESPNEMKNKTRKSNIPTPGTVTKWRKCLTPVRTYSRHGINVPRLPSSSSVKKVRNLKKNSSTQGTVGTYKLEIKRRKIIVDPKTTITPKTFKQQQYSTAHLRAKSPDRLFATTTAKDRKKYEVNKKTAFDMLTAPSRTPMMSSKLTQQFKKACVNKASSTCPKYKILCKIPPLEKVEKNRNGERRDGNIDRNLPPSNITVAAMMEKACSNAIQSSNRTSHMPPLRWSFQQM
ncbi:uncharacterized protein LOC105221349 [Zeugodacus cucurbitae]|uniref:uncharacterized protein LOC105221349 n=1 Tax=Zeugodacus cucurbitae TaxID=28588 RepID=UPI0023D90EA6|nr:uncharacterized protein LOC105221349 [Zeugodacus cucurbitae]